MTIQSADFIVIGGGIAGASVGYELSAKGKVGGRLPGVVRIDRLKFGF